MVVLVVVAVVVLAVPAEVVAGLIVVGAVAIGLRITGRFAHCLLVTAAANDPGGRGGAAEPT